MLCNGKTYTRCINERQTLKTVGQKANFAGSIGYNHSDGHTSKTAKIKKVLLLFQHIVLLIDFCCFISVRVGMLNSINLIFSLNTAVTGDRHCL